MAYIVYPMPKAPSPYGNIFHAQVPVIITTVMEYEDVLGQSRADCGCASCDDLDPIVITLGPTQCGVWLKADVLLDTLASNADTLIAMFDLDEAWWWDWARDFKGDGEPDIAVLYPPHQARS